MRFKSKIMLTLRLLLIIMLSATGILVISFNPSYAHIVDSNNTQVWRNTQDNLKIQFGYKPEKPIIDTFTNLAFSVTDLRTDDHINDSNALVTVTNGQRLFKFENISVPNGDFSVDYIFPDDGTHQVLLRLDRDETIQLASFQVFVPHQSASEPLSNLHNMIISLLLISAVGVTTMIIIRRK